MAMRQRSLAVDVPSRRRLRGGGGGSTASRLVGKAMLLPTVLILVGLVLYPFVCSIWLSFFDKTIGSAGRFVGLANFRYVIAWLQFSTALVNTVVSTVCAVAIKFVLGMVVALVLNQQIRGRDFFARLPAPAWVMLVFRRVPRLALACSTR